MTTEPTTLEARKVAEEHIRPILDWPAPWIALLLDQLLDKAGPRERWDLARVRRVLREKKWNL